MSLEVVIFTAKNRIAGGQGNEVKELYKKFKLGDRIEVKYNGAILNFYSVATFRNWVIFDMEALGQYKYKMEVKLYRKINSFNEVW